MFKLFYQYLKKYRGVIIVFAVFVAVFCFVFYLYDVAVEPVLYAFSLCAVIGLTVGGIEFYSFAKRSKSREILFDNIEIADLPRPRNIEEADYLKMIDFLRASNREDEGRRKRERTEYIDYYGLWIHQIKTPIASMGLILQEEDTEKNRALSAELFRIEQYAEMALWYLRMDEMADMVIKEYALDGIIKDAVKKYAPLFIRKKIKLNYEHVDAVVLTDAKWLSFIIEQLLANAVRYTKEGSVTITEKDKVLSITDTGIGIAQEDLPRIFEKGYTGYNGREERKSTGIGLYLVRKAADKLSHRLTVSSEINQGSTFSVDLNSYKFKAE